MHVLVFSANVLWKEWGEQQGWTWKWLLSFSLYERVNWTVWVKCWGEGINVGCGIKLPDIWCQWNVFEIKKEKKENYNEIDIKKTILIFRISFLVQKKNQLKIYIRD